MKIGLDDLSELTIVGNANVDATDYSEDVKNNANKTSLKTQKSLYD
jgi:hypothetical protein